MTSCISNLSRRGLNILSNQQVNKLKVNFNLSSIHKIFDPFSASRQLYSLHSLGLDEPLTDRSERQSIIPNKQDFINSQLKRLENSESNITLDDLEDTIFSVEKDPIQVDLLSNMIKKYNLDKNFKFENVNLGIAAMRTLHHLNEHKRAFELFQNEKVFFDDLGCYIILMDLLFENGRYYECRKIFEYSKSQVYGSMAPLTIVFAACCKQVIADSSNRITEIKKIYTRIKKCQKISANFEIK